MTLTGKQVVDVIRAKIAEAPRSGGTVFTLSSLSTLVDQLEKDASTELGKGPFSILFTANHETALAKYRVRVDFLLEQFKSVIAVGQAALKSMFLANGGAAVAVLAFAGHLATSGSSGAVPRLAFPLAYFVLGLIFVTVASGVTYLAQRSHALKRRELAKRLNKIIVLLAFMSVAAFATGCWFAYAAIAHFAQTVSR